MGDVLVVNAGSTSLKLNLVAEDGSAARLEGLEGAAADAVGHRIVHGGSRFVEPVVVDREILYSILPHRLLLKYVKDPTLNARVRRLVRSKAVAHPLRYARDLSPRRRLYVLMALVNQVRKFRRYYPEVTSTGF